MRIVFATKKHLPALGGGQLTVHHLARELSARGHSVTVLSHEPPGARSDDLDYPVVRSTARGEALSALLAETWADAVVVHAYHRSMRPWAESILDAAHALPTVLYLHDAGSVELAVDRHADVGAVAAVSAHLAGLVAEAGTAAEVVYPMVDARDYRVPTTRRRVLFVNPAASKGLDAMCSLAALEPEIAFVWARCWPLSPEVVEYVESQAGRLDNVEFRRDAVRDPAELYRDARVLLVPSVAEEAYGRVAREALMSGIPVIASDVGGLPESVGEGGVLMRRGASPEEWAVALRSLLDDEALYADYVARAERQAATESTSAAVVGDQFERLLERAAQTAGSSQPSMTGSE
jgi:glycosyltransferase involved in cell wall biosynthesis